MNILQIHFINLIMKTYKEYSELLLDDYAGFVSEDSAVHQYTYQHIILKNVNKDVSDELLKIAITEMRHLSLLGDIVLKLGELPKFEAINFYTNNVSAWSANYINYETNIHKMMKYNISIEESAIKKYKEHISLIDNQEIKLLLKKIIDDELKHVEYFKYCLKNF